MKKTIALHDKGYYCAQAVAHAYCDLGGTELWTHFRKKNGTVICYE